MSVYIDPPIDTDPQDILADCYAYLASVIPGWTPAPGQLDVWLLMSIASVAAESRDVASAVPKTIFRWFGANLINLPPDDATSATVLSTWTMQDNAGYFIPAGTQVSIAVSGDVSVAFVTEVDVTVPPGSLVANNVQLVASIPGADGSGLGAVGGPVELIDPLAFVTSITQNAMTTGGVDAESDDDYLNRLVGELQLLAPRPILPDDFAVFARNIAGCFRAVAIDGYNPADATYNNPRMVTIAGLDSAGAAISAPVKASIVADLQARREVGFIVNSVDPVFHSIDVSYTVKALPGYDFALLVTAVNAAITTFLDPSTWGSLPGDPRNWTNVTSVRYLELAQTINEVLGVDYIEALTLGLHGGALAAADVALVGVAPLPTTGTLTGVAD